MNDWKITVLYTHWIQKEDNTIYKSSNSERQQQQQQGKKARNMKAQQC